VFGLGQRFGDQRKMPFPVVGVECREIRQGALNSSIQPGGFRGVGLAQSPPRRRCRFASINKVLPPLKECSVDGLPGIMLAYRGYQVVDHCNRHVKLARKRCRSIGQEPDAKLLEQSGISLEAIKGAQSFKRGWKAFTNGFATFMS
jgi:hypothetical protein